MIEPNQAHVTVIARLVAKPGEEKNLEKELVGVAATTRLEEGCIEYVVHRSRKDVNEIVIYETWASEASLAEHHKAPHMGELMQKMPALLAEPFSVSLLTKVG